MAGEGSSFTLRGSARRGRPPVKRSRPNERDSFSPEGSSTKSLIEEKFVAEQKAASLEVENIELLTRVHEVENKLKEAEEKLKEANKDLDHVWEIMDWIITDEEINDYSYRLSYQAAFAVCPKTLELRAETSLYEEKMKRKRAKESGEGPSNRQ